MVLGCTALTGCIAAVAWTIPAGQFHKKQAAPLTFEFQPVLQAVPKADAPAAAAAALVSKDEEREAEADVDSKKIRLKPSSCRASAQSCILNQNFV